MLIGYSAETRFQQPNSPLKEAGRREQNDEPLPLLPPLLLPPPPPTIPPRGATHFPFVMAKSGFALLWGKERRKGQQRPLAVCIFGRITTHTSTQGVTLGSDEHLLPRV